MDSSILLFTISGVRLEFLARKYRYRLTISIILIRLLTILLLGGGLLVFTRFTPYIIPGLQGPNNINPLFRRDDVVVVTKFMLSLFLNNYESAFIYCIVDNILLVGHVPGIPVGFIILIIITSRRRE